MQNAGVRIKRNARIFSLDIQKRCPMANHAFARTTAFLSQNDYRLVSNLSEADVVLLNTCGAFDPLVSISESFIESLVGRSSAHTVVIFGCLAAVSSRVSEIPDAILIPHDDIDRFSEYFEHAIPMRDISPIHIPDFASESGANILISNGCVNACSYCQAKAAKGYVSSRPISDIADDVSRLVENGQHRIILQSDDTGSYGHDINTDLTELLAVLFDLDPELTISIQNYYPGLFLEHYAFLRKPIQQGRIAHMCLPMQSGSPRILRLMNRMYDPGQIRTALEEIQPTNGHLSLKTHFIVNFPTETMEDFELTLDMTPLFHYCDMVPYVDNANTPAHAIEPKCTEQELAAKLARIRESDGNLIIHTTLPEPLRTWKRLNIEM